MKSTNHPCGSLPVTGFTVSVWFCHHHQAWWGVASSYSQTDDVDVSTSEWNPVQWGPFDTWSDVSAWMVEQSSRAEPPLI